MNIRNAQRFLLPLLALATPCLASEQSARLLMPSLPRQASATFDGRVFFSAPERRALEAKPAAPAIPATTPVTAMPPRRYDGSLWRDGRIVAMWFDGNSVDPATEPDIRLGDGIPATTLSGRQQPLLPGQNWPPQGRKSEQ
jgi:hypothetical protein